MPKRHKCCPFISQTWIALAFLLGCAFFMAMLQLYVDSLPDYPMQPLQDVGFSIIPYIGDEYRIIADIMVLVAIVVFLAMAPFFLVTPQLAVRRWFLLLGSLFLLRGLVLVGDRYPRVPYKFDKYQPSNPIVGALAIMAGVHSTATDFMYSGHTVNFTLAASFVARYTYYGVFSFFFSVYCVLGVLALIATREHYTTDVVVAFIIAKLAFWVYHLFLDAMYKRFWVSGVELEDTGDVHLTMPVALVDATGQRLELDKHMVADEMFGRGTMNDRQVSVLRMDPYDSMRSELYQKIKWLDAN